MCRRSVTHCLLLSSVTILLGLFHTDSTAATAKASVTSVSPETEQEPALVTIHVKSRHSAIDLAAAELAKFLGQMAGDPKAAVVAENGSENAAQIELGLLAILACRSTHWRIRSWTMPSTST